MSQDALCQTLTEWLRGSLSGDLESHPGKELSDHLLGTARLACQIVNTYGFNDIENDIEQDVLRAALTHDLGKADKEFQSYLHGQGKGVDHSLTSAYFTFSLPHDKDPLDALFSAEAVRRHHSSIEEWQKIRRHWINSKENEMTAKIQKLLPQWPYTLDEKFIPKFSRVLFKHSSQRYSLSKDWLRLRSVLSILVAADRLDAINVQKMTFASLPTFKPYDFIKDKTLSERQQRMNEWRAEVAQACFGAVAKIEQPGLFTLTLPTGAGKTNIGLKVAHMLAEKLGYPTIIYALPFISIVEQNADFAKKVFDPEQVQEDHSLMLAKDERQAKTGEDETDEDELIALERKGEAEETQIAWVRARRLFRYWEAPVVITTMAQLWSTLLNPRAGATIDFHRLRSAVVLMDEPQGIDSFLWHGLGKLLSFIYEQWKTTFILMTATQPKIFEDIEGQKVQELAPACQFPFNRHQYHFIEGKYRLEDVPELLQTDVPDFLDRSGMMVFNTRMAARKAYDLMLPLLGEAPVFVLSRWMTPQHRREVIQKIKDLEKAKKKHYLIATQVVEAGVDLDFEWVLRDMGPLDSIIQVAGRCNRNAGNKAEGTVVVAELQDEEGRSFSGIYDAVLLDTTWQLLKKCPHFEEKNVPTLVTRYYDSLVHKIAPKPVWERVVGGEWGEYTPLFKDEAFDVPVYVDLDGKLDNILNQLMGMEKILKNRDRFKQLNSQLQQYMIGVPEKRFKEWWDRNCLIIGGTQGMMDAVGDLYYVIRTLGIGEEKGKIYHPTAGFSPWENNSLEDW